MKINIFKIALGSFIFATLISIIIFIRGALLLSHHNLLSPELLIGSVVIYMIVGFIIFGLFKKSKLAFRVAIIVGILSFISLLSSPQADHILYTISGILLFSSRKTFSK